MEKIVELHLTAGAKLADDGFAALVLTYGKGWLDDFDWSTTFRGGAMKNEVMVSIKGNSVTFPNTPTGEAAFAICAGIVFFAWLFKKKK